MTSIFTRIIDGEIPSFRIYEDDAHYAFLDIHPLQPGHTLVVPKREVPYLFDLEPDELAALWKAAQVVAKALREATACARIVTLVVGYEVPHAHIHLIPTNDMGEFPMPTQGTLDMAQAEAFAEDVRVRL